MSKQYAFGPYVFDIDRRLLLKGTAPVEIGQKCAILLETLLAAGGKAVSKSALMQAAWQTENIEESNLAVQIAALRKCLGKPKCGGEWIATVHRVGYQFVNPDEVLGAPPLSQHSVGQAMANRPSIAVLPFANKSGDPEKEYFSDGLTDDIITELSRFQSLVVTARSSSLALRRQNIDIVRTGHQPGVQYTLEGSVRQVGNRIRISAQLVEAGSGRHVWAERYDSEGEELFVVQDELVRTIVGTLVGRLHASAVDQIKRKPPESVTAYDYVLRGNALSFEDSETASEARRLLRKAIELDPGYARAYALLADLTYVEWWNDMVGSHDGLDRAFELAMKAVALDDNDYTSQGALGWALMLRQAHELAEHHLLRSLQLNPNRASMLASLGGLYAYQGRSEEGMRCFDRARLLDPFFGPQWYWRMGGVIHFSARQYDDAVAAFSRSLALPFWGPAYVAASHALVCRGADARRHAAEVLRLKPDFSLRLFAAKEPYKQPGDRERLLDGLRKAGLPE
jgi:TolB-like protein/Tfp pilus assembly protein PilF